MFTFHCSDLTAECVFVHFAFSECLSNLSECYFCVFKVVLGLLVAFKGRVDPRMKILSFTPPKAVPNLCKFLSSVEHKR